MGNAKRQAHPTRKEKDKIESMPSQRKSLATHDQQDPQPKMNNKADASERRDRCVPMDEDENQRATYD